MKQVVLIGDSIRMGYQATVASRLAGVAICRGPDENGGDSANVREQLDRWAVEPGPDLIHLNCGLHDIKVPRGGGPQGERARQVPLDAYRENLEAIFARLREATGATLIWATTTPVIESRHNAVKDFDRYHADVDAYNAAALEIANRFGARVDDLHAFVVGNGPERMLADDGVHYHETAYRQLGEAVAACVQASL